MTNVISAEGVVRLEEINEEDEEGYSTGVRASLDYMGYEACRTSVGNSRAEALRRLAARVENMDERQRDVQNVRIENALLPVGLMEDYTGEDTEPVRGEDGGEE